MVIYLQFIIIIKYYLPKLTHQNEDGLNFIFYIYYTVKPPKRPPKMQGLVVAYGRWLLTRVRPQGQSF